MKAHLVFGDPRSPGNRVVFTKEVPESGIEVSGTSAQISDAGRVYEGGLLNRYSGSAGEPSTESQQINLLLSESIPGEDLCAALDEEGWAESAELPRPDYLPFPVTTTLIIQGENSVEAWEKNMWLTHAFAPTQRMQLEGSGIRALNLSCLSMTLRRHGPHQAVFAALERQPSDDRDFLNEDGWVRAALEQGAWASQIRLSQAVEAQVTYVLGATVVSGAIIHNVSTLESLPYIDMLAQDVLEEVALALYDMGRADLVPDDIALPSMKNTDE